MYSFPKFPWNLPEVSPELEHIEKILNRKSNGKRILPPAEKVFRAFEVTPKDKVKLVIIGQDPYSSVYHGVPVANGIAFSTDIPDLVPKSLGNIYKEIQSSFPDFKIPKHGNLMPWAKQGVLLLNRALTVYEGESANHMVLWEGFISKVVTSIVQTESPMVFALWGSYAKNLERLIVGNHIVLTSPHPVMSNFLGCGHFNIIKSYLDIDWKL